MSYIYERKHPTDLFYDLKKMGRENFSYKGAKVLMEYLEDSLEPIEYDPIALCCEFSEYKSIEEFNKEYGVDYKNWVDAEKDTLVIRFGDNSAVVQVF